MSKPAKDRSMKSPTPNWSNEEPDDLLAEASPQVSSGVTADDINLKVQQAQTQLLELKRQQEEIERQRRELEELSRKQREFEDGRREILEKLTRGLVVLERQEFEIKREAEQIQLVRETFGEHLKEVEAIKPQDWQPGALQAELTRALAIIDQAQAVHGQARARLDALREEPLDADGEVVTTDPSRKSFGDMVRDGFAYSLPVILLGLVYLFILITKHSA